MINYIRGVILIHKPCMKVWSCLSGVWLLKYKSTWYLKGWNRCCDGANTYCIIWYKGSNFYAVFKLFIDIRVHWYYTMIGTYHYFRTSRPGFEVRVRPSEADETSDIVSGQRRTRANNVFGASTNKTTNVILYFHFFIYF